MPFDAEDARKLDALGTQLGAVAVQLATLAANVDGLRGDIARQGDGHADHEVRLRALESRREADYTAELAAHERELSDVADVVAAQGREIAALQRIRWMVTGAAFAVGSSGGVLITKLLT